MTFEEAVKRTSGLQQAYQPGLQALGSYSTKVDCEDRRRLSGSVNLEEALVSSYPQESLWDYGIGFRRTHSEEAIWIEVHSAASTHVDTVLKKLRWLKKWLKNQALQLNKLTRGFYWLATDGSVNITKALEFIISKFDVDSSIPARKKKSPLRQQ